MPGVEQMEFGLWQITTIRLDDSVNEITPTITLTGKTATMNISNVVYFTNWDATIPTITGKQTLDRWCIAIASLANVALAFCFLQHREYLWGIRDYRYVPINMTVTFLLAAVPTVVVVLLIPLIARGRNLHRWIGIALIICRHTSPWPDGCNFSPSPSPIADGHCDPS